MIRRREFITGIASATAWPMVAGAQQADRVRRIGVLMGGDEKDPERNARISALTQGLADLGWTDGGKVRLDVRWPGADPNRIRALAQELVGLQPDIILTVGTAETVALQRETRTIPIVFEVADPVASGIVARLDRVGTSPASPPWKPRWQASRLSCSGRLRRGSSGPQSCSTLTSISYDFYALI